MPCKKQQFLYGERRCSLLLPLQAFFLFRCTRRGHLSLFPPAQKFIQRVGQGCSSSQQYSNLRTLTFFGGHVCFLGLLEICIKVGYAVLNAPVRISFGHTLNKHPVWMTCAWPSFWHGSTQAAARNQDSLLIGED